MTSNSDGGQRYDMDSLLQRPGEPNDTRWAHHNHAGPGRFVRVCVDDPEVIERAAAALKQFEQAGRHLLILATGECQCGVPFETLNDGDHHIRKAKAAAVLASLAEPQQGQDKP